MESFVNEFPDMKKEKHNINMIFDQFKVNDEELKNIVDEIEVTGELPRSLLTFAKGRLLLRRMLQIKPGLITPENFRSCLLTMRQNPANPSENTLQEDAIHFCSQLPNGSALIVPALRVNKAALNKRMEKYGSDEEPDGKATDNETLLCYLLRTDKSFSQLLVEEKLGGLVSTEGLNNLVKPTNTSALFWLVLNQAGLQILSETPSLSYRLTRAETIIAEVNIPEYKGFSVAYLLMRNNSPESRIILTQIISKDLITPESWKNCLVKMTEQEIKAVITWLIPIVLDKKNTQGKSFHQFMLLLCATFSFVRTKISTFNFSEEFHKIEEAFINEEEVLTDFFDSYLGKSRLTAILEIYPNLITPRNFQGVLKKLTFSQKMDAILFVSELPGGWSVIKSNLTVELLNSRIGNEGETLLCYLLLLPNCSSEVLDDKEIPLLISSDGLCNIVGNLYNPYYGMSALFSYLLYVKGLKLLRENSSLRELIYKNTKALNAILTHPDYKMYGSVVYLLGAQDLDILEDLIFKKLVDPNTFNYVTASGQSTLWVLAPTKKGKSILKDPRSNYLVNSKEVNRIAKVTTTKGDLQEVSALQLLIDTAEGRDVLREWFRKDPKIITKESLEHCLKKLSTKVVKDIIAWLTSIALEEKPLTENKSDTAVSRNIKKPVSDEDKGESLSPKKQHTDTDAYFSLFTSPSNSEKLVFEEKPGSSARCEIILLLGISFTFISRNLERFNLRGEAYKSMMHEFVSKGNLLAPFSAAEIEILLTSELGTHGGKLFLEKLVVLYPSLITPEAFGNALQKMPFKQQMQAFQWALQVFSKDWSFIKGILTAELLNSRMRNKGETLICYLLRTPVFSVHVLADEKLLAKVSAPGLNDVVEDPKNPHHHTSALQLLADNADGLKILERWLGKDPNIVTKEGLKFCQQKLSKEKYQTLVKLVEKAKTPTINRYALTSCTTPSSSSSGSTGSTSSVQFSHG